MKLRATKNRILVLEAPERTHTNSGFIIPVAWRKRVETGWIESIGPDAHRQVPELKEKMNVAFRPYSGLNGDKPIEFNGRRYRLLTLDEMIGVIGPVSVKKIDAALPK